MTIKTAQLSGFVFWKFKILNDTLQDLKLSVSEGLFPSNHIGYDIRMITDKEIEAIAEEQSLTPHQVEKDYVHGWILNALSSRPLLAEKLILKGGNALRKGYFHDTRFSKDLDFSCSTAINQALLEQELREICSIIESQTQIKFLDKTVIKDKNLPFDSNSLEARVYFKGFYNEEKTDLKTQLDVTQFDQIILPTQNLKIIHPYSDANLFNSTVQFQKAEEVLASKLTTILHRRKVGDLFDLLHGLLIGTGLNISAAEVIRTFLKKSIFEQNPNSARDVLLETPLTEYSEYWETINAPKKSRFGFDIVTRRFPEMITSLFAQVADPVRQFVSSGGGMRPRGPNVQRSRMNYGATGIFSGSDRSAIIAAGQARKMIQMTYHGQTRLVEPYSLEYYVRQKDGVGNEYFWGFDTTGGNSGKVSIKRFFSDQIQNVSVTDRDYVPRYAVDL